MMCNWPLALESVEGIFQVDPFNPRALYVKAEALYNKCHFEQALMFFHRGKVMTNSVFVYFLLKNGLNSPENLSRVGRISTGNTKMSKDDS